MPTIKIDENAINNLIKSPKKRKTVYGVYAVLGIVIGSIQVGFDASGAEAGTWLSVATSVYIYLSVPFGVLALVNAPSKQKVTEPTLDETEDNEPQVSQEKFMQDDVDKMIIQNNNKNLKTFEETKAKGINGELDFLYNDEGEKTYIIDAKPDEENLPKH